MNQRLGQIWSKDEKQTNRVRGVALPSGEEIAGYEIHMGHTEPAGSTQPLLRITREQDGPTDRFDGCVSEDQCVWGTYVHGLFDTPGFRREFLNRLRRRRGWQPLAEQRSRSRGALLDSLAELVRRHLDCQLLNEILTGIR